MVKGNSGLKSGVSFGVVSLTQQQQQSGTAENSSSSIISESSSVDITDGAKLTKAKKLPYKTAAHKSPKGPQKVHLYQIGKPALSPLVITLVIFWGYSHNSHIHCRYSCPLLTWPFLAAFN